VQDLFDEVLAGGELALQQLVADRRQEGIDVEFKTKANPANGEVTKEDRKNLGIALSALSNSMGGTLVWGVEATKNSDSIDCASALRPICQIQKFQSEITRLVSQALMPRHEGIRIASVSISASADSGYLLIRVDRSDRRPHRCEFGEKQYFKRIGDSSIAMEHYDIEDSFKRLVVPTLTARFNLIPTSSRSGPDGSFSSLRISISLENTSSVSARFPYLIIEETSNIQLPGYNARRGFQYPPGVFEGGADDVIHPERAMHAQNLEREFRLNQQGELPRGSLQSPILITYRCGSLHSRPSFGTFKITENDVATALGLQIEPPLH
jgi:hypothetical protein